jgi:DNA-binding winged helix-turn-helix (wHTH) protein/tetratricopeptide (TPR) repeat protein
MIREFGEFSLDDTAFELRRGKQRVKLEPKVFDVLRHLVLHRDRVVPKAELLDALWPGEYVTESALPRAVAAIRKALGDDRAQQRYIRTVHGRGYQFVARVADRESAPAAAETATPPSARARREPTAPLFVGREAVLERLEASLDEAIAGRGRLVLLFGEPGIGKTRTAQELAERARARGFETLAGRCEEGEGVPAFWPWVQVLRSGTEDLHDAELEAALGRNADALAHLVPELAERLSSPPALPPGPDEARFRLFEGVADHLARRSEQQPLLLHVDDLHWADRSTALLLRHLVRQIGSRRIVAIGSYREVEVRRGSALREVLSELVREPHAERVALRGLERAAVARLLEAASGSACDEALVSAVAEITEGNPFFLNETLRLLAEEGALRTPASRRDWDASLPQGLRDVIGRRLDGLSETCNRVITVASVAGAEFGFQVLSRFAELEADALLEVLDEAVSARVIVESREVLGRYAFSHALIRQSVYEELSTPERVRLHRRLAEILEAQYREAPEAHLDALAHHFFQAAPGGDVYKAIDYAARAGRAALRQLAYEEAAGHFERALQAHDLRVPADATRRCELLLELGDAHEKAADRRRMREVYSEAAECARQIDRPDLLARAALGFSGRTERGTPDTGMRALLEEARDALGDTQPGLRARLLGYLVGTPPYTDSLETRLSLSQQALDLARGSGDTEALLAALAARAWAIIGPDHARERLPLARELLALAERANHAEMQLSALESEIRSYLAVGDMAEADRAIEVYRRIAESLRQPVFLFMTSFYDVARAISTGRFEAAETHIAHGFELGLAAQHPATGPLFWGQILWLALQRGDVGWLDRGVESMRTSSFVTDSVRRTLRVTVAQLELLRGRLDAARRELNRMSVSDLRALPRDEHWLSAMVGTAEVAVALGDDERARAVYELLLPYADLNSLHDLLRADRGAVARYLGLVAAALGDVQRAADHYEAALELNERMGALPQIASTQADYAELLARRGRPGDRERAGELRAAARQTATRLGMARLAAALGEADSGG